MPEVRRVSLRPNLRFDKPVFSGLSLNMGFTALIHTVARVFAFVLYAVFAMFEPLVRIALFLIALVGFLTCVIYRFLLKDPGFPFWTLLLFSVSLCVLWGLYALLLRGLSRA